MLDISIENVILPNKQCRVGRCGKEIKDSFFQRSVFTRVFLLDTLPRKPNKKECGMVNFDKSGGPGTHWVAWYKNSKTKIYFNSYGIQPPIEVSEYLGSPILYNTDQLHRAGHVFCGHLCLYVLKELGAGNEFQSVLNKLF